MKRFGLGCKPSPAKENSREQHETFWTGLQTQSSKKTPLKIEPQEYNRFRFWGKIEELESIILRVITLADKLTIHNAFPDRRFKS
jgi:hypothetical protein